MCYCDVSIGTSIPFKGSLEPKGPLACYRAGLDIRKGGTVTYVLLSQCAVVPISPPLTQRTKVSE